MKQENIRWLILAAAILLIYGMSSNTPELKQASGAKQYVADITNQTCTEDADCPCFGTYGTGDDGINAYGIGVSSCEDNRCDTTWCYDMEPIADWFAEDPKSPWTWVKQEKNTVYVIVAVGLLGLYIFWPK